MRVRMRASAPACLAGMGTFRFSRHARNNMRLYGVSIAEISMVLADPARTGHDERGNTRFDGHVGGKVVRVVIARDDPTRVITVFERRR